MQTHKIALSTLLSLYYTQKFYLFQIMVVFLSLTSAPYLFKLRSLISVNVSFKMVKTRGCLRQNSFA